MQEAYQRAKTTADAVNGSGAVAVATKPVEMSYAAFNRAAEMPKSEKPLPIPMREDELERMRERFSEAMRTQAEDFPDPFVTLPSRRYGIEGDDTDRDPLGPFRGLWNALRITFAVGVLAWIVFRVLTLAGW